MRGRRWTECSFTGSPASRKFTGGVFAGVPDPTSPWSGMACNSALVIPYFLLGISSLMNIYQGILLSRGFEAAGAEPKSSTSHCVCPCASDVEDVLAGVRDMWPVERVQAVEAVRSEVAALLKDRGPRALGAPAESSGATSSTASSTSAVSSTSGCSSSALSGSGSSGHGEHAVHQHDALFFLFNIILLGTAILQISSVIPAVQFTVLLFVLGMILSLFLEGLNLKDSSGILGVSYKMWMDIDPHLLLFAMLPALLAGDAMSIDTSVAKRVAHQCLYLAGPGVLCSAMSVAGFLTWYLNWPFLLSLVTASILCATDPVAVVALLKELGASPMLTVQIQGESLLNDGTAIVLYTVAYDMLRGESYDVSDLMMFVVKTALMACAVGAFLGYMFFTWIRSASDRFNHASSVIQIMLTLCAAYWSFIMAEGVLKMSGVLSTVASSLILAHHMWPHIVSQDALCHFWHCLEDLMNIIIFLLGGALCGAAMVHIELSDYLNLMVIYLFLLLVRGTLIFGSRPVLRWLSHDNLPVTLADAAVMTWGGLRGAVGLALAIQVRRGRAPDENGVPMIDETTADRVLFFVSGIAFLTTVVNATSAPYLVQELGITALPAVQERVLRKFHEQLVTLSIGHDDPPEVTETLKAMLHHIDEELHERSVKSQKKHARVENAKKQANQFWGKSKMMESLHRRMSRISASPEPDAVCKAFRATQAIFNSIPDEDKGRLDHLPGSLDELATDSEEMINLVQSTKADEEMCKVVNKTFMALVYNNYHKLIQAGDLRPGSPETDVLFTSIRVCLSPLTPELTDLDFVMQQVSDNKGQIGHVNEEKALPPELMEQYNNLGRSICVRAQSVREQRQSVTPHRITLNKIAMSDDGLEDDIVLEEGANFHARLDRFVKSQKFALTCVVSILLNAIYVAADELFRDSSNDKNPFWLICEWSFCVIFSAEAAVKILHSRSKYFKDGFNKFDFFLVILGIIGAITSTMSFTSEDSMTVEGSNEGRIIRISRVLRTMRFLRIFRLFHARLSADKFVSRELAVCMHKMQCLTCFVHGHMIAQNQLLKYFMSDRENIRDVEIARCILQSKASVHKALISIISVQRTMDADLLDELKYTKDRKRIVEYLESFVQDAANEGAISAKDAHSILHPMHAEIASCLTVIAKRTDGFLKKKPEGTTEASQVVKVIGSLKDTLKGQKGDGAAKPKAMPVPPEKLGQTASASSQPPASPRPDEKDQALQAVIGTDPSAKLAGTPVSPIPASGSQMPSLHQADSAGGVSFDVPVKPLPSIMYPPGEGPLQQLESTEYVDLLASEPQEVGDGSDDRKNVKRKVRKVKKPLARSNSQTRARGESDADPSTSGVTPLLDDNPATPVASPPEGVLDQRAESPPSPAPESGASGGASGGRLSRSSLFDQQSK